jgi:hypothetical protein
MIRCLWYLVDELWFLAYGFRVYGLWFLALCLWSMVCVANGLWFPVDGFW